MKIPNWLNSQWFYKESFRIESILGHLNNSFMRLIYSKKKNLKEKIFLTLNQSNLRNKIRLPLKMNIELKTNKRQENSRHGENQKYQHQILFKSQKECVPGFKTSMITSFNNKSRCINGIIKRNMGHEIQIFTDDSKKLETYKKKNVLLLVTEDGKKLQTCSALGLVGIIIQAKPIMNKKYATWLKSKIFKAKIKQKVLLKTHRDLKKRIEERIRYVKLRPFKFHRMKRVRQKDEIYLNMILKAFDNKEYLNHNEIISLTGESWNFLRKSVKSCCDLVQNENLEKKFTLKENYRISDKSKIIDNQS